TSVQPDGGSTAGVDVTEYAVTGPPLVGAVQLTVTVFAPCSATVGGPGVPGTPGVIASDATLNAELPLPVMPLARTWNVYDVVPVRPGTMQLVAVMGRSVSQSKLPGVDFTV